MGCTCMYQSVKGIPTGGMCSHILAVLNKIKETGSVQLKEEETNATKSKHSPENTRPATREPEAERNEQSNA